MTTTLPTTCLGKNIGRSNETNPSDQARAEAQAKWDKKRRTGYWEDPADVDQFCIIEPTLATPLDKIKGGLPAMLKNGPVLFQTKYNGGCLLADRRGLWTRKGERVVSLPHIEEALVPFFEAHPDALLHGEAFNEGLREKLNELMSIYRTTKPEKLTPAFLARSKELVEFFIYDAYGHFDTTEETPYSVRKHHIDMSVAGSDLGSKYGTIPHCRFVPTHLCQTEAEVWNRYEALIADGHEGGILRFPDSPYEHKRTKRIVKLKPTLDDECAILAIKEGTGNWVGTGKVFTVAWKGREFDVTLKGSMEEARTVLQNPERWLGQTVTFLYTSLSGLGVPCFARVDYNNCFKS